MSEVTFTETHVASTIKAMVNPTSNGNKPLKPKPKANIKKAQSKGKGKNKGTIPYTVSPTALRNILGTMADPAPTFTKSDFQFIDWIEPEKTKSCGEFADKVRNRELCWEVIYRVRTIPSVYLNDPEMAEEVIANMATEYDEFEISYVHQGMCTHAEFMSFVAHIFIEFLDPQTHLIAAQAKVIPVSLADHLRRYGPFKNAVTDIDSVEICYQFDPKDPMNWDFFDRPLTSTPQPMLKGK